MIFLAVVAVICGLAFLPLGFRFIYRADDPGIWLLIGWLKFRVYPGKKQADRKEDKKTSGSQNAPKKGGSFRDFKPVIRTLWEFLGHFRRKIRVDNFEFRLILAGDDPGDLAINYGRAWAALGNLIPQLERLFVIKKRDLEVECDFASNTTRVYASADITITVARAIHLLSCHGLKTLKHLLQLKKLQKGGAEL